MINSMKILKFIFSIAFAALLFIPQMSKAVTVMPPILENIVVEPGSVYEASFTIINETDVPQKYYFNTKNIFAQGEEGKAGFVAQGEENEYGLASWIEFNNPHLVIMPNEDMAVDFKINIPKDAEPGGHYAAMFTSTLPPEIQEGVGLGENTGVLLLVTVPGDIREKAELMEFSLASGKSVYTRPPIEFLIRIKNEGNVHFKPKGNITISGWAGEKAVINANSFEGRVLPDSIRALHPVWKGPKEKGNFWQELKNEWNNFGFGRYNAHLEMEWGTKGEKFISNVKFWLFPWRVLLVGALIVIILIVLIRRYNKAIVKKAQKKTKK